MDTKLTLRLKLSIVALLFSAAAFSQDIEIKETPFNRFVKRPDIEWAMYVHDTMSFNTPPLSKILLDRLKKRQIKIANAFEPGSDEENLMKFKSAKSADSVFLTVAAIEFDYGEQGISKTIYAKDLIYDQLKDQSFFVSQIFYIKNKKLQSYVPFICPQMRLITPEGTDFGMVSVFTTAVNYLPHFKPGAKDKIRHLLRTERSFLMDSIDPGDRLKEVFGKNLIRALWTAILSDKCNKILLSTEKKISTKELLTGSWTGTTVSIPVYDSMGNSTNKDVYPEINAGYFKKVMVTQTWFYDETKNVIFTKIPDITLFANITDKNGVATLKPAVKIVF